MAPGTFNGDITLLILPVLDSSSIGSAYITAVMLQDTSIIMSDELKGVYKALHSFQITIFLSKNFNAGESYWQGKLEALNVTGLAEIRLREGLKKPKPPGAYYTHTYLRSPSRLINSIYLFFFLKKKKLGKGSLVDK